MSRNTAATRPLPHFPEAERAVLGYIFLFSPAFRRASALLVSDSLYVPAHQVIFQAMASLSNRGRPLDVMTVHEQIAASGQLEKAGGAAYLAGLADVVVSRREFERDIQVVREAAARRALIGQCADAIDLCYLGEKSICDVASDMVRRMDVLYNDRSLPVASGDLIPVIMEQLFDTPESVRTGPLSGVGMGTLWDEVGPGDLVIVAAPPSSGKNALVCNLAARAALRNDLPVLVFSRKMDRGTVICRMLAAQAGVNFGTIKNRRVRGSDLDVVRAAADALGKAPLFIDDTVGELSVSQVRAKARRYKTRENIGLVVVDDLQSLQPARLRDNLEQEVMQITHCLKILARELDIPVLATSRINRRVEARKNKNPLLVDLRDSGAIEGAADMVVFIHEDNLREPGDSLPIRQVELVVAKQRNSATTCMPLLFVPSQMSFVEHP